MNSERKRLAAFTLTAALLLSSVPMLFAAPLAATGSVASSLANVGVALAATPVITATPGTGSAGTTVTVTGSGFTPLAVVTIVLTASNSVASTPVNAATDANGNLVPTNVVVPSNAGPGVATVVAREVVTGNSASTIFKVVPALTSVAPTSGGPGTSVTVHGSGFALNSTVMVTFTSSSGTVSTGTATTDATGAVTVTFIVASNAGPGTGTIDATDASGNKASGTFTVVSAAALALSASSGTPGSTVTVNGTGYAPNAVVTVTLTPPAPGSATVITAATSPTGTFTAQVAVATNAGIGTGNVNATDAQGNSASAPFAVTAPTFSFTPSPASGVPQETITVTAATGTTLPQGNVNLTAPNGVVLSMGVIPVAGLTSIPLVVPAGAPAGIDQIMLANGSTAPFTVLTPTVTIVNPVAAGSSWLWGAPVFVAGSGFSANRGAAVQLVPTNTTPSASQVATTTAKTDAFGNVVTLSGTSPVAVNIPVGQAPGTYEVYVTDTAGIAVLSSFPITVSAPSGATTGVSLGLSVANGSACAPPAGSSAVTVVPSSYNTSTGAVATAPGLTPEQVIATVVGSAGTFLNGETISIQINGSQFASATYPVGPSGAGGHDANVVNATFAFTPSQLTGGKLYTVNAVGTASGNVATAPLFVCAPSVSISSTNLVINTPYTVSGSGFASAEQISGTYYLTSTNPITFGAGAPGVTQAFTSATNATGGFTSVLTPTQFGVFTLRVTGVETATNSTSGVTDLFTTTTFTVTPSAISTSPAVFPSQSFVISATNGFVPGETLTITPAGGVSTTVTVNSSGGFAATLTAPPNTPVGNLAIQLTSSHGTIPIPITQAITVPVASLSASPNVLAQGQTTTVSGTGYIPNQPVTLTTQFLVNGTAVDAGGVVMTTTASSAGTFTATYPVSPSVVVVGGSYWIRGVSAASTANAASTPVTLTTTGVIAPPGGVPAGQATTLYFAEGYTGRFATNGRADFDEYLSVLNPDNFAKTVTFTYLLQGGSTPVVTTTSVPANSDILRSVNGDVGNDQIVSAIVSSNGRIAVERIINRTAPSGKLDASSSLGTTAPSTTWYFAEGYTGASFQEYLTLQNPGSTAANVVVTFLPASTPAATPITVKIPVPANGRATENIRRDYLAVPEKSVGMIVTSDQPVVAERVEYWGDGNGSAKFGADTEPGMAGAAKQYFFAYGSAGNGDESYVTVINPAAVVNGVPPSDATVLVSFFDVNGSPLGSKSITVSPQTRETVVVNDVVAPITGTIYTAVSSDQPIFVERPQYIGGSPNSGSHPGLIPSGSPAGVTSVLFPNVNTGTASGTPINETVYLLNTGAASITVNGTYYDPNGQTVSVAYTVPSGKVVVVNVNADAGNLPVGPLGAQYTSANGAFVAARVANTPDGLTYVGTQGVTNQ